jgi:hypothetical protein
MGSRHDGKRFPGCLEKSARPSPSKRWSFYFRTPTASRLICSQTKETPMPTQTTSVLRKYWKPALVTGAGSTTLFLWFEEIILIGLDILVLFGLVLLAGPIFLFNHFLFKSATPRPEDKQK